jgi:hypothetical protein
MRCSDSHIGPSADVPCDAQCSPMHCTTIVDDKLDWRMPRKASAMASSASKVVATRWFAGNEQAQEFIAETPADGHVVKIALRNINIRVRPNRAGWRHHSWNDPRDRARGTGFVASFVGRTMSCTFTYPTS